MVSERDKESLGADCWTLADARRRQTIEHVAWHGDSVRIGLDDAQSNCAPVSRLSDCDRGPTRADTAQERPPQMVRNFVRLLAVPATVETLQMMERSSETVPPL
jgi:hypothetical protein